MWAPSKVPQEIAMDAKEKKGRLSLYPKIADAPVDGQNFRLTIARSV